MDKNIIGVIQGMAIFGLVLSSTAATVGVTALAYDFQVNQMPQVAQAVSSLGSKFSFLSWGTLAAAATTGGSQTYTSSGTFTVPTYTTITVECWGAGGGGGASRTGHDGTAGGASSFGSLMTAGGGTPGLANGTRGAGGTATGGTTNINGNPADDYYGGTAPHGGGAGGTPVDVAAGHPGAAPGGGGSAGENGAASPRGGPAGSGAYVARTFNTGELTVNSTIPVTIGTGGAGGACADTGCTTTKPGGAGGAGQCNVSWSYTPPPPPPTPVATTTSATNVYSSRAAAMAADLTNVPAIETLGYAIAGDGGGATFKNMGTASASDVGASFKDAAGNTFQYVAPGAGIDVRQFGAKVNWDGNDAAATNDYSAIQNALNFAGRHGVRPYDAGGYAGNVVIIPAGTALVCGGTLTVPDYTTLQGDGAATLKLCEAGQPSTAPLINLCDPTTHLACFGARLRDIVLFGGGGYAAPGTPMIYSNNVQQLDAISRISVYTGLRQCMKFEIGYGGAALIGLNTVFCSLNRQTQNDGIVIDYGPAVVSLRDVVTESVGAPVNAIKITNGHVLVEGFHVEGIRTGISVNITSGDGYARLMNLTGGNTCASLVSLGSTNVPGNTIVGTATPNGCTDVVTDNQPGGHSLSGVYLYADRTFNP